MSDAALSKTMGNIGHFRAREQCDIRLGVIWSAPSPPAFAKENRFLGEESVFFFFRRVTASNGDLARARFSTMMLDKTPIS
jgi:hypothetical protein